MTFPEARRLHGTSAAAAVVGLAVSLVVAFAVWSVREGNEDRLLGQRVREAAAVLEASLPGLQIPLATAAELAEATGGDRAALARALGPLAGADGPFGSVAVWQLADGAPRPVLVVGGPLALGEEPPAAVRAQLERAATSSGLTVLDLLHRDEPRLGFAFGAASSGAGARYIAYGESELPEDRTSVPQPDSAFAGLDYALYLDLLEEPSALLVASRGELPISGRRAEEVVSFGDRQLLLVMSPRAPIGGSLLQALPWLVLAVGAFTTLASALLTEHLLRGRDVAEALARDNARLYEEQRDVAHTLQHRLLPQGLPEVAGCELAVHYRPGVAGMRIGGDWYEAMPLGGQRALVVIGDVSGRGLEAAAVMASARYAIRALAGQGDPPSLILAKLNDLDDPDWGGHFATVLCGVVDLADRKATFASAGHPPPLLVQRGEAGFVPLTTGPPLGVAAAAGFAPVTVPLPPEGTLLLYTDGLFERRGETIDDGLERLRRTAGEVTGDLPGVLDGVIDRLGAEHATDDVAILGLRWPAPLPGPAGEGAPAAQVAQG